MKIDYQNEFNLSKYVLKCTKGVCFRQSHSKVTFGVNLVNVAWTNVADIQL